MGTKKVYDPRGMRLMWFEVDKADEEQKDPGMK